MPTLEEEYAKYQGGNYDNINSMYDAQQQSQLSALEQAYNQNLSNAEAARDQQGRQYQARANDLSVQYERNRRNLNQQAAANGLNTGAGSQMQLALGSNYQRDYGGLRTAQQQALDEANRGIEQMKAAYQSSVQQAVADNDYKRAQALMAEYQNQYARQLQQAQTLASYGDFSAYLNIPGYTQEQVDAMRNTWIASNPDLAYNTGSISADQYYQMTGRYPAGAGRTGAGGTYNTWDEYLAAQAGNTPPEGVTPGSTVPEGNWNPGTKNGKGEDRFAAADTAFGALIGKYGNAPDLNQAIYQIGTSRDPDAEMAALLNSPYYRYMTEDQKRAAATAYEHATGTGAYAPPPPRTGEYWGGLNTGNGLVQTENERFR